MWMPWRGNGHDRAVHPFANRQHGGVIQNPQRLDQLADSVAAAYAPTSATSCAIPLFGTTCGKLEPERMPTPSTTIGIAHNLLLVLARSSPSTPRTCQLRPRPAPRLLRPVEGPAIVMPVVRKTAALGRPIRGLLALHIVEIAPNSMKKQARPRSRPLHAPWANHKTRAAARWRRAK